MGKAVFIKNVGRVFFPDEMADDAIKAAMPKVNALASDYTSRMARAKEQGFDTSQTYYHGTPEFRGEGFDKGEIGSNYNYDEQGFFFSNDPRITSDYATSNTIGMPITGGQNIPVHIAAKNPLVIDADKARELGVMNPEDEGIVSYWDNQHPWILEEMESGGHDAIKIIDRDPAVAVNGNPQEIPRVQCEPILNRRCRLGPGLRPE